MTSPRDGRWYRSVTARRAPRYRILLWLARGAVVWESLWPRLWPANAIACTFLVLAFFDILPQLPALLHAGLLTLIAFAFIGALFRGIRGLGLPAHETARHRVERDSGLDHRPLAALEDDLAAGRDDGFAKTLWQAHHERLAGDIHRLQLAVPAAGLARIDPWGIRAAVILILIVGLVVGPGDAGERLARAAIPDFSAGPPTPVTAEVWLTPPAYTGVAPIFLNLNSAIGETLTIPAGTALLAQISGPRVLPSLNFGEQNLAFSALGGDTEAQSYRLETTLDSGTGIAILAGEKTLADWPIRIIADSPPSIKFVAPPDGTDRGHLRLRAEAADDYGIKQITTEIRRTGPAIENAETLELRIPLPSRAPKKHRLRHVRDLTSHLWAGHPVRLNLRAKDVAGHTTRTEPIDLILPERAFLHPVARAIVAERKKLADPTDAVRAEVSAGLGLIGTVPHRFAHDTVVFLAISLARGRLRHDRRETAIDAVAELLWETALRLEDGGLSIAERDLRRAEDKLMEALERGADRAEIERLLQELQNTLRQFLAELSEELTRMGAMEAPIDPDGEFLDSTDLQNMIDEVRELAQSGSLEAARQRLAELKRMLQDLRAGMRPQGRGDPQQAAEARKLMDALQQLTKRQQELLDRTFPRLRENQGTKNEIPGSGQKRREGQPTLEEDAAAQEALRRELGNLMLDLDSLLGGIPEPLGKAERAMRRATGALGKGDVENAIEAETEALEHLRSGGQNAARQMSRGLGLMPGFVRGQQPVLPLGSRRDRDPFGRRSDGTSGFTSDDSVKVPDKAQLRRAEDIVKELRRRAGERQRPRLELDYIERLLKVF